MNFDCDTKYNGENNCDVVLEDVKFVGLSATGKKDGMVCKGVKGTATGLTGLDSCLKTSTEA